MQLQHTAPRNPILDIEVRRRKLFGIRLSEKLQQNYMYWICRNILVIKCNPNINFLWDMVIKCINKNYFLWALNAAIIISNYLVIKSNLKNIFLWEM